MKKSGFGSSQYRMLLGAAIIVAMVTVAVIVGILVVTKGVEPALLVAANGIVLSLVLIRFWLHVKKGDANT